MPHWMASAMHSLRADRMPRVTFISHSRLETEVADELVQRLCMSFVAYATAYSGQRGQIRFPFGWCNLEAHAATLHITAGAEDLAGLERVEGIVVDRLKRVAGRQQRELILPLSPWSASAPPPST